jgi:hypothetical protein
MKRYALRVSQFSTCRLCRLEDIVERRQGLVMHGSVDAGPGGQGSPEQIQQVLPSRLEDGPSRPYSEVCLCYLPSAWGKVGLKMCQPCSVSAPLEVVLTIVILDGPIPRPCEFENHQNAEA